MRVRLVQLVGISFLVSRMLFGAGEKLGDINVIVHNKTGAPLMVNDVFMLDGRRDGFLFKQEEGEYAHFVWHKAGDEEEVCAQAEVSIPNFLGRGSSQADRSYAARLTITLDEAIISNGNSELSLFKVEERE